VNKMKNDLEQAAEKIKELENELLNSEKITL
jgi:hypothetical protein